MRQSCVKNVDWNSACEVRRKGCRPREGLSQLTAVRVSEAVRSKQGKLTGVVSEVHLKCYSPQEPTNVRKTGESLSGDRKRRLFARIVIKLADCEKVRQRGQPRASRRNHFFRYSTWIKETDWID